ncbi:hypothetical protein [Microcoleus sp. FACHB-831]|nr:hypothetical protein [Microcoleus sp. FACHB-831]
MRTKIEQGHHANYKLIGVMPVPLGLSGNDTIINKSKGNYARS